MSPNQRTVFSPLCLRLNSFSPPFFHQVKASSAFGTSNHPGWERGPASLFSLSLQGQGPVSTNYTQVELFLHVLVLPTRPQPLGRKANLSFPSISRSWHSTCPVGNGSWVLVEWVRFTKAINYMPAIGEHVYRSITQKAEAEGPQIWGQSRLQGSSRPALGYIGNPAWKNKSKKCNTELKRTT